MRRVANADATRGAERSGSLVYRDLHEILKSKAREGEKPSQPSIETSLLHNVLRSTLFINFTDRFTGSDLFYLESIYATH